MKSVKRMTLCLLAILTVVNIPFRTMADSPTISDFTFSSVATMSDTGSSLNVQITVSGPEAEASKISGIYCSIAADGTSLGAANGLGANVKACKTGEAAYVSSQDMTVLIIGSFSGETTIPQGTPVTFSLDYDIATLNLSDKAKVTVSIPQSGSLCTWNGTVVKGYTPETELTSCTISSSGGNISSSAVPEEDISNSANATVTGTVDNGTATLNVVSENDKACVVSYTTDDGANYTRVNAVKADSGYNFVVPDYTDAMKFVVALKGDINGDGSLTGNELSLMNAVILGKQALTPIQSLVADINGDGKLSGNELSQVNSVILGKTNFSW